MAQKRLLICWIGHNDLRPMALAQPETVCEEILSEVGGPRPKPTDIGPIRTLLDQVAFDEVVLLSNYKADWSKRFETWIGGNTTAKQVKPTNPTDYRSIFVEVDAVLAELRKRGDWKQTELCIHLSPGTPAMTAVWVLLGKSKYPATFYQSFNGKAWVTEIPFDLFVDFIPELYGDADARFQHLASQSPMEVAGFERIIGNSNAIRIAVGVAKRAAVRSVPVLLLGESGTGKEMFAKAIHDASPRKSKPFLAVNCAAFAKDLLESELFGHTKGAFTGSVKDRKGAFEEADGGTLFLDEVGECSLDLQAKLLRVLQPPAGEKPSCRIFRRVGDSSDRRSDVRIVAATNRDLLREVREGRFREDLYYRLAVVTVTLPALRDRKSDIPALTQAFLEQINQQSSLEPGHRHKRISESAIAFVAKHSWPGNVRQLFNSLLQAVVLTDGDELQREDLVAAIGEAPVDDLDSDLLERPLGEGFSLDSHLNDIQRHYLRRAMIEAHGVKAEAARLLGMKNYQTLDAQLKRLDVRFS